MRESLTHMCKQAHAYKHERKRKLCAHARVTRTLQCGCDVGASPCGIRFCHTLADCFSCYWVVTQHNLALGRMQ